MRLTKTEKIIRWINHEENVSYGALHLMGDQAFTYNVLLSRLNREQKIAVVNVQDYSVTSSGHRNRVLEALQELDFTIYKVPNEAELHNAIVH